LKAIWKARAPSKMLFSVGSNLKKNFNHEWYSEERKDSGEPMFFCRKAAEAINDLLLHCAGTRS